MAAATAGAAAQLLGIPVSDRDSLGLADDIAAAHRQSVGAPLAVADIQPRPGADARVESSPIATGRTRWRADRQRGVVAGGPVGNLPRGTVVNRTGGSRRFAVGILVLQTGV
jgi:hypothetical protein